ncbi:MAG: pitrilysin family protein [Bacteroidota bacterium]|nr:pitrilysin family protein [Bacteroidota bacterium]
MKKILFIIIIISFSSIIIPQDRKIVFTEYDLENGLHVILHQNNSTPIVAITVTYHVGSKNEQLDRTGFAHFFEHLMFEGSDNIKRGEYFQLVQNAGGELNASTSFDQTVYYEELPSNQIELGLWLESERMLHLKIDSIGVETQRGVVKEERKQRLENQPYGSILEQTFSHAYKQHPYRWTPIGSVQYIDKAKLSEFMEFYKTFYVPNNAVLSISGDFETGKMKEIIKKYFSDIPKGTKPIFRPSIIEPKQTSLVKDTVYDNIQLPAVIKAFHIPAQGTDDYYALNMLTTLLSSGQSSRFYKQIVDKQQKALFVGSFPFSLEDPGLFLVYSICNVGVSANQVDSLINKEILKVQSDLIDQKEFEKLRNQVENDFVGNKETNLGIATSLANYYLFFKGNTNLINTELERYMKVTREDIKRVANEYLTDRNETLLYYLPKSAKVAREEK